MKCNISDFIGISSNDDRFLTVWPDRQDIEKGLGNYSADLGMQALELYENLFNSFYPLPKENILFYPTPGVQILFKKKQNIVPYFFTNVCSECKQFSKDIYCVS